jgi:hypothetical protein
MLMACELVRRACPPCHRILLHRKLVQQEEAERKRDHGIFMDDMEEEVLILVFFDQVCSCSFTSHLRLVPVPWTL